MDPCKVRRSTPTGIAIVLTLAGAVSSAPAAEFKLNEEIGLTITGTITAGTGIRTEELSPAAYGSIAGTRVGRNDGLLVNNAGSPNLNFEDGSAYSTVVKGIADFDIHGKNLGAFARLQGWYDFELSNGDRPYGNFPNGFTQNVPLSDNGFAREAEFSGIMFTDAFVYGKLNFAPERTLDVRVGRQVVSWGTSQFTTGGINVVNPTNFAAFQRPGFVAQELKIPVGMVYANFAQSKQWGVDGFVQYEFRHDVISGCGTYLNIATFAPTGCLQANVLPISEATTFRTGAYVHRLEDINASDSGQFGLSLRYAPAALDTEFRAYAMNYHSRMFSVRGTNPNVAGGFGSLAPPAFSRLTDPNGVKYALIYPEDIELYGLSFNSRLGRATRLFGEFAYRPNQPLSINFADLADAFVARNPNSILNRPASGKNALALPPGATFDAYDRYNVTTTTIGLGQGLPGVLGADRIIFAGELGWSHVVNLPDPSALRYGRSEAYGVAAVPGAPCVDVYPGKTCALNGFITENAWGYRARISATYNEAFFGASLTFALLFLHDVDGYSYDGTFLEDRRIARPSIRAEWGKKYFAEILYTYYTDSTDYSLLVDRDNVVLFAGVNF
jgi:hypothetical protein